MGSRVAGHTGKRAAGEVRILPITVSGEIRAGESLGARLLAAARSLGLRFQDGDILVVKHKVVSKAEGALVALDEIRPSAASRTWARRYGLDARVRELAMRESRRIVRRKRNVLITETKHGFRLRQQRRGCIERGWWAARGVAAGESGSFRGVVAAGVEEGAWDRHRGHRQRQFRASVARRLDGSGDWRRRNAASGRLPRTPRSARLLRCTRRSTRSPTNWPVPRAWFAASWRERPRASFAAMVIAEAAVGRAS